MKLEYTIHEQDFLSFQLFEASKSLRINRKKRNGWIVMTIVSLLFAYYSYSNQNNTMTIYFLVIALITGLFYPKYFIWRYKRHYKLSIKEAYSNRFGQTETLEITDDFILSKDKTGEGKINLTEVEKVNETQTHFFIKLSTGLSLIIPKAELDNTYELRSVFKKLKLQLNDETNWTWK